MTDYLERFTCPRRLNCLRQERAEESRRTLQRRSGADVLLRQPRAAALAPLLRFRVPNATARPRQRLSSVRLLLLE